MRERVLSENPCLKIYSPNKKYKTQRMYDDAVDDYLAALNFFSDWFVASKMFEKFNKALLFNEDFNKVTLIANQRHTVAVDLDKINIYSDNNLY